jgi:hypothetical protein
MSFWDDWFTSKRDLQDEINEMLIKSDTEMPSDMVPDEYQDMGDSSEKIGRKAILEDPYFEHLSQSVVFRHKMSRLSNKTLKDVSVRDWLVSSIIQVRCDTLLRFSRISHDKFKTGFRIVKKNDKEEITKEEQEEIHNLEHFLYNCGRTEGTPEEDKMLFGEFLKLTARDALTFGHVSVEKIKTRSKGLHRFRPVPAESVYLINKQASLDMLKNEMESTKSLFKPGENDPSKEYKRYQDKLDYIKYVQVSYDNRTLADFGDEDMIWHLFNPQNFADSMGYCYSPLELAIINITNHLNVENYNANFFTHGYAARGILHLKGTVTQSQLHAFRRQYYNTISGAQHAWRTPIIAGLDEVEWVPLAGSAKEMEYIDFNNHLLRAICSQFQIDPVEIGLDYLGTTGGSTQQASQEYKIEHSKERGLHTLLMFFEDLINRSVIPAIDMDFAEKYKFEFTGYEDETPQTLIAQLQAEMTVHSSMNDLLKAAQKCDIKDIVADLPLNSAFWALIEKNYTKGEIREIFFGDKDASKRRELQYIPGDPAFMGWQQLLLTMDRQKMQDRMMKQQQEAMAAQQEEEASRTNEQHSMEKEKHDIEVEQHRNAQAHAMAQSVQDTAKEEGVGTKPLMIGGVPVANPLNKSDKKSDKSDE